MRVLVRRYAAYMVIATAAVAVGFVLALARANAQDMGVLGPSGTTVPTIVPSPATVASGGASGSASGGAAGGPGQASAVIFPEQSLPLRFSHVQHLRLPGRPSCSTCHRAALTSRSSLDDLMPPEAACRACHAIDRGQPEPQAAAGQPPARCVACHPGYQRGDRVVARVRVPAPYIKFDHQAHTARNIVCTHCHGDLAGQNIGLATRAQLPRMRLCLDCHDGKAAPRTCTTCHLADAGGFVRTAYPSGTLVPSGVLRGDAHDPGFRTAHAAAAQNSAAYCASCHQQSFCLDCHDGTTRPLDFHAGDYITLHPIEARRNSPDCSTCHRLQTFCTGCHARSGVSADGRGSEFDSRVPGRRFHPPGWADPGTSGPGTHGFEAQRNIRQCASCHREQFCVDCHSAEPGGLRVSPHPPGWATSRRCQALLARNPRVCLRCHVTPGEARCGS